MEGQQSTAVQLMQKSGLVPGWVSRTGVNVRFATELGRFVDVTNDVPQSERLFDLLSAFALQLDCPWTAYCSLTSDQKRSDRSHATVMLNYPDDWKERYDEMGFETMDPIITSGRNRLSAFRWSELYRDQSTTESERIFFEEAARCGLRSGVSIPLHGPTDSFAITSFARPSADELQSRVIAYLHLAAMHFHLKVAKRQASARYRSTPELTVRELECLLWISRGKSSWEIGNIIGISPNTVNFHTKKAMTKLNTSSRTAAAVKAVKFGLIECIDVN
ncbi:LuxR family transcriptional regulator [Mesorhizobium sp.]|uniref:LuxR family transcriptional regulator n=1 Tax=Mesorhizobium sp. TaxID=1871066 RepID=UPI0025FADDCA|nr:LuxR family transcriptional regulator [Mesorhizobium sp.]